MSERTIGADGNDEKKRSSEKMVDYLIVLRATLNLDQAADMEDCDEVIIRHQGKHFSVRADVKLAEVIQ
jgi:hypothetical protein